MSSQADRHAPQWLRSEAVQRFVLSLCAADELAPALELLASASGDLAISETRHLGASAGQIEFDSDAAAAWSLWQFLKSELVAVDSYLQPRSEMGKRLLICDMDMTIVDAETLDEVAALLGLGDRIAAITRRAMRGEIDFNEALRERIMMLAGQPEQVFREVAQTLRLNPGAETLLATAKQAGLHCILISGGFAQVAEPVAARLGFDEVYCNRLQLDAGRLTGEVLEPVVNAEYKRNLLVQRAQALQLPLEQCCAIGDGANDLPMLNAAGLGIAYRAKPLLRAATHCHIDASDLSSAIHFMGLNRAGDL